ncbi:cation-translocating P-type ATPase [Sutterella sp.]|uniref:heavy metal translocating P-type ATPase n=1 Tax=Sutterella sp. TaxID=1981025 RepID=UPI0026DF2B91|nr:cation-translocating P-type ATPase [Sutterella sp.]MDO5531886.1 cation-translocating P-type ATPase [Sutterella sp.]
MAEQSEKSGLPGLWSNEFARAAILIAISAVALVAGFFDVKVYGIDPSWVAIILCGVPIIIEGAEGLIRRFDIKADVLVSLALIASVIIGEYFAAGEVAVIMQLGALLEELTVARARKGIERLASLAPETARVVEGDAERIIQASEVAAGVTVRVLPGETVPVDGEILSGTTSVDESVLTGEAMPVDKGPGDSVMSGSINRFGAFDMRADQVGESSTIARMAKLVESADASRAEIVRLADRWATWIVVMALSAAFLVWLVTGEEIRAVTILVVFCPCALVLATPTAVMAAIGCATKKGVLVREGDALERLAEIDRVAFDKTGTLTTGEPAVSDVQTLTDSITAPELLKLAAVAEKQSEHPLGAAIVRGFKERNAGEALPDPAEFSMESGSGVRAQTSSGEVAVGRLSWLKSIGAATDAEIERAEAAALPFRADGASAVFVSVAGSVAGFITLSDRMRPGIGRAVSAMKSMNVAPMLMTGDHPAAAMHAAEAAGIDPRLVESECMPETKLERLASLEKATVKTAMVGDGINDAPALKRAWVGIAMGGVGSDIAVNAADIVLVRDDIRVIPWLVKLSRRMMRMIRFNITLAMGINFAAIILAALGLLGPVLGALVHNAGSVLVILNSARLLRTPGAEETTDKEA